MKILEFHIENIRGLPDLHLKPDGKNLAIWGPNGAGKSGVVDAIDFLLSGRISRLMGRGTGGITLARHGPHVDSCPEDARVRATVLLHGSEQPIEIGRCIANPDMLECPDDAKPELQAIETLARRGQHVLTRREILKYITAEPATRAEEIQELLDLSDIEEIRKSLVTASNRLRTECEAAVRDVKRQRSNVSSAVQQATYGEIQILAIANENRRILGGQPITELNSAYVRRNLNPPIAVSLAPEAHVGLLERDVDHVRETLQGEVLARLCSLDDGLRQLLRTIRADPDLRHELGRLELTELGLQLLDGSGKCPLCDTQWEPAELQKHLEGKRVCGREARKYQSQIDSTAGSLRDVVDNLAASVEKVAHTAARLDLKDPEHALRNWAAALHQLSEALTNPLELYSDESHPLQLVSRLYSPEDVEQLLQTVLDAAAAKYPKATPQQIAWDTLNRLEGHLMILERDLENLGGRKRSQERAEFLLSSFEAARDKILQNLYDQITDRFVEFYKILHEDEADHFCASIAPEGAALSFRVDFLGRGSHPPHALHSEGHQDSMGLCLFLALSERLSEGKIDLVVLDDVVMSVDTDHRREVCRLLTSPFPGRQFIITTHDRTWARQLRTAGVVDRKGLVEFTRWTIETGPLVGQTGDLWERVEEALQRDDVPDAASRLRRGIEEYFEMVCDALKGEIAYRSDGRWTLQDWLPAAMEQYKSLLKVAKASAQSWNNSEAVSDLQELDSVRAQIFERSQVEQWAINAHVHYNNWANLTAGEFRTIVEAFRDLYGLFECSQCGQPLKLTKTDGKPIAVNCACGKVNWNLQGR